MVTTRSKPFDRFGSFVMFKKIDSDVFGELWRVAAIENGEIGPLLALRKFTDAHHAFAAAISAAGPLAEKVTGATVVKNQRYGVVGDQPYVTWEYGGGRTLRHIIDRSREGGHAPIPTDQALALAEKVASSLDQVANTKVEGKRLLHGSLLPEFVWIYEDGDVRTACEFLNSGLLESLSDPEIAKHLTPYMAPEIRSGGTPTRTTDVYSIGAILFLAITGQEPPQDTAETAGAIAAANLMYSDEALPDDIRGILETAMADDPLARYPSAADAKEAITGVLNSGDYSPTTFNLAFYLHTLLRKEMEGEAVEREKESKVTPELYLEEIKEEEAERATAAARPAPAPAREPAAEPAAPEPDVSAPTFGAIADTDGGKSRAPMIAVAALVIAAGAVGTWMFTKKDSSEPTQQAAQTQAAPAPAIQTPLEVPVEEPVITELPGVEGEATTTDADEAAREKAIEDEVRKRLAGEVQKLQDEYNQQIKQQLEKDLKSQAPATPPPASTPAAQTTKPAPVKPEPAAADAAPEAGTAETGPSTSTAVEVPAAPVPKQPTAPPPPPSVKVGDLVVNSEVDTLPAIANRVNPTYPPIAARRKISALIIVSALVDENGKVIDAKILRGDDRKLGFEEASLKAIRKFTFTPATKSGKKVKTWHSVPFIFGKQ